MVRLTMGKIVTKNCWGSLRTSSQAMSGKHYVQEYWKLYQKKHYARGHNQDHDLRTPDEECVASDKDDWQIDMPDVDEIDYIDEASVDDDSTCPRTRPKLCC
jgi:hypothetical protein